MCFQQDKSIRVASMGLPTAETTLFYASYEDARPIACVRKVLNTYGGKGIVGIRTPVIIIILELVEQSHACKSALPATMLRT